MTEIMQNDESHDIITQLDNVKISDPLNFELFNTYVQSKQDKRIILPRIKEVLMWIFGDLSFLPFIKTKNKTQHNAKYKVFENEWGKKVMKQVRPDLKFNKQ